MPASAVNFFTFTGGINSEATPLSIKPEDLLACENAKIERNGSITRRKGIDFIENNGDSRFVESSTLDSAAGVNATYGMWDLPSSMFYTTVYDSNGVPRKFLFATLGDNVRIFNVDNISTISDIEDYEPQWFNSYSGVYGKLFAGYPVAQDISLLQTSSTVQDQTNNGFAGLYNTTNQPKFKKTNFTSDKNRVFIINEYLPPIMCTYTNDRWEWRYVGIRWRDLDDEDTSDHVVYRAKKDTTQYGTTNSDLIFHISTCIKSHTTTTNTQYPPAALGEKGDTHFWDFLYATYTSPVDIDMIKWRLDRSSGIFSSDRATGDFSYKSNVVPFSDIFSNGTSAFGRLWLCGTSKKPNHIFFSQMVIEEDEDRRYGFMFSKADPRSQYDAAPSDTDGGYIVINDAVRITSLIPYKNGVLAFAPNGVWFVGGVSGGSFRPTAYSVEKISDMGLVSPDAVTKYENIIFFFSQSGIYVIQPHEQDPNSLTTISVSDKIQSKYLAIPTICKELSLASYNSAEKRLYFWHNDEIFDWTTANNKHNTPTHFRRCLIYDVPLAAWYEYTLINDDVGTKLAVLSAYPLNVGNISSLDDVVDELDVIVTDEASNDVQVYSAISTTAAISTNLLILGKADPATGTFKQAFGLLDASSNTDFSLEAVDEESFDSDIEFAHTQLNDIFIEKSIPYIQFLFKRVESGVVDGNNIDTNEGGAKGRFIFDWATGSNAGPKYGELKDIYFPDRSTESYFNTTDPNIQVVTYRHKLRGRGKSFRIQIVNDGDRPFSLYGYQLLVRGNRGG